MSPRQIKPIPFHESKRLSDWARELWLPSFPQIKQDRKVQQARPVQQGLRGRRARRVPLDQLVLQGAPALQALLVLLVLRALLVRLVRLVA